MALLRICVGLEPFIARYYSLYTQTADTVQNRATKGVQNYFKHQFVAKKSLHLLEKSTRKFHFSLLLD